MRIKQIFILDLALLINELISWESNKNLVSKPILYIRTTKNVYNKRVKSCKYTLGENI